MCSASHKEAGRMGMINRVFLSVQIKTAYRPVMESELSWTQTISQEANKEDVARHSSPLFEIYISWFYDLLLLLYLSLFSKIIPRSHYADVRFYKKQYRPDYALLASWGPSKHLLRRDGELKVIESRPYVCVWRDRDMKTVVPGRSDLFFKASALSHFLPEAPSRKAMSAGRLFKSLAADHHGHLFSS
jgi:hypothetical protein